MATIFINTPTRKVYLASHSDVIEIHPDQQLLINPFLMINLSCFEWNMFVFGKN